MRRQVKDRIAATTLQFLLMISLPVVSFAEDAVESTSPITIASGQVSGELMRGEELSAVVAYKGIPYAAPPIGNLRWRPPQPVDAWDGVRDCTAFAPAAMQNGGRAKVKSEDCLYLNVWTPAKREPDAKLPVLVWIHGGGLTSGAGHLDWYHGESLARRNVVVVTLNYRLGVFGYFAHPDLSAESPDGVSGNYGFWDQIAALRWIQQNIDAFGGDAKRVTVFGESAGGTSVFVLGASPHSKGLFQRSILQSPWLDPNVFVPLRAEGPEGGRTAEAIGAAAAARVIGDSEAGDTDTVIAKLRELSAEQVLSQFKARHPVAIGGALLPDHPESIYRSSDSQRVPSIVGTNRDEGTMFAPAKPFDSIDTYEASQREMFGEAASKILDEYAVANVEEIRPAVVQLITDGWFVQPARRYARSQHGRAPVWMYHFERRSPTWPWLGAAHAAEIPYVFGNLDSGRVQPEDRELSEVMMDYWVQFATTGDPNRDGLAPWPAYTIDGDEHLVLDTEIRVESGLRCNACDLLDSIRPVADLAE